MTTQPLTDDTIQMLLQIALDMTRKAYIPYSHYPVGAALLAVDGTVFTG
ncbi:MAG: hypothetical protein K8I60_07005, partial [Anaerolineae bacterium]|nr:hypothetical protein [Anaerolineae bacterium]